MVIHIINSCTRKVKHFNIAMFLQFLFVDAINHRITNYCTSTRLPMKFFVGFCCFLYVFFSDLWMTKLFRVFVVKGIFRRQWFTTSVQRIFLIFFFFCTQKKAFLIMRLASQQASSSAHQLKPAQVSKPTHPQVSKPTHPQASKQARSSA